MVPSSQTVLQQKETSTSGNEPLVTVILPVYAAGEFLRPALLSILNQSYRNLDILIVDEGSPDNCMQTIADLKDERIRIIKQERAGKASALNRAVAAAHGEFYAIQDADDLSHPDRIRTQLQCLLDNPQVACVFCGYDLIIGEKKLAPLLSAKSVTTCRSDIDSFSMPGHDPTTMYRLSLVKNEAYDEGLPIGQGLDYILRIGEKFPMMVVGSCLYSYRIYHKSQSRRNPTQRDQLVRKILGAACKRRGIPEEQWPAKVTQKANKPIRPRDLDNNLAAHFMESTLDLRRAGRLGEAIRTAWFCTKMQPLDPHYLKALVYSVTPLWALRFLRRSNT